METPQSVIQKLSVEIMSRFETVYNRHIKPKMKIDSKHYLMSVAEEVYEELGDLMEITNETLYPITKRRREAKKRWLNKELEAKKGSGLFEEIDQVARFLYENHPIEKFKAVYEVDSLEELRLKKVKELQSWFNQENAMLCDFPYLNNKKVNQINTAMTNDIQYLIVKTIKEEAPKGEQSAVISVTDSLARLPYDYSNRIKLSNNEIVEGKFFENVYYIDDKTRFESRLKVEALEEGLMQENLRMLNKRDHEILAHLLSQNHEALYQPVPMIVEIGDIVRATFGNDSKKNYMAVKESLIKMDFMELRVIDEKTLRSTKTDIFYNVTIEVDEATNKEVARIVFSENLIHEFVKNKTVSIYKNIIDRFSLNTSKVLIFALQRQRILCATHLDGKEPIVFHTNLNFFRGALVFGAKRRLRQLRIIEDSLDEIVKSEITLKSYTRKGDNFELVFYPFSDKERKDLLNNNQNAEKFLTTRSKEQTITSSEPLKIL